jgi:hypothetical protein
MPMDEIDGLVRFFTSGLDGAKAVTPAQHSYSISCVAPVHFTSSHGYGWISVFCDGTLPHSCSLLFINIKTTSSHPPSPPQ